MLRATSTVAMSKLSAYDDPSPQYVLVPTSPTRLEQYVGTVREQVQSAWRSVSGRSQKAVESVIGTERGVEQRLRSLRAPEEELSPALLYIGVAALSGSILTRNRNILLRFLAPPVFLGAASAYLLPRTTDNVRSFAWDIEKRNAPALADVHSQVYEQTGAAWRSLRQRASSAVSSVDNAVTDTAAKLKDGSGLSFPKDVKPASLRNLPTSVEDRDQADAAAKLE